MITNLYIQNFKSLKEADLNLSNLNLLTGLNGSGKSSLLQVFLLLRQSSELNKGKLLLHKNENELFDGGVAQDVYYQYGINKEIIFRLKVDNLKSFEWNFACDILTKPNVDVLLSNQHYPIDDLQKISLFTSHFQYLSAERVGPKNAYPASLEISENQRNLGMFGEYAIHFLHLFGKKYELKQESLKHPNAKSDKLIHQTEAWMSEIVGNVRIETEEISNEEVRLLFQFDTNRGKTNKFKPKNVGFGLSYVLSVVISLLVAEKDKLILIENPESHIHPRGQSELGKLLAAAAQCDAQLLIETHSDHILNGIRIAVKQQNILPEKVLAYYFKRNDEDNHSEITPIVFTIDGRLRRKTLDGSTAKIPKGFFDEWTNSMAKLL